MHARRTKHRPSLASGVIKRINLSILLWTARAGSVAVVKKFLILDVTLRNGGYAQYGRHEAIPGLAHDGHSRTGFSTRLPDE